MRRAHDGLAYTGNLVRGEIVHDDHAVLGERRREQVFIPGHERLSIHGTVAQHGRDKAVGRQFTDAGDDLPVSERDRRSATLSLLRPSSQARHLVGQITFVDEDQAPGVKLRSPSRLPLNPAEAESAFDAPGHPSDPCFREPGLEPVAKCVPQHAQNIERRTQQRPAGEFRRRNRRQNIESLGCPRHGFDEHFAREGGDQHALT